LGKVINEIKTKRETVEITQTESLSDNQKHEIAKTVKLSRELLDES
jgi:F0F1-type ATP synthase delta subunit